MRFLNKVFKSQLFCMVAILSILLPSCQKNAKKNIISELTISNDSLRAYPTHKKSNSEVSSLVAFANGDFFKSSFLLDSLLKNDFIINLPASNVVYLNNDSSRPVYYVAIQRQKIIIGFVIGIMTESKNNNKIIAGYRDYSNYNYSSLSGTISDWDLNYNYLAGVLTVNRKKVENWTIPSVENKNNSFVAFSTKTNKAKVCDTNGDGNIGFGECYKCMKDACNNDGECMALCDLLFFGSACSGTIAVSCLYISATQ